MARRPYILDDTSANPYPVSAKPTKRPTRRLNPNAEETIEAATVSTFGYLTTPARQPRKRVRR